jgi:hypothetical protein
MGDRTVKILPVEGLETRNNIYKKRDWSTILFVFSITIKKYKGDVDQGPKEGE